MPQIEDGLSTPVTFSRRSRCLACRPRLLETRRIELRQKIQKGREVYAPDCVEINMDEARIYCKLKIYLSLNGCWFEFLST